MNKAPNVPQLRLYQGWLEATRGLSFDSYEELWRWSVSDLDAFWRSIWEYDNILSPTPFEGSCHVQRAVTRTDPC